MMRELHARTVKRQTGFDDKVTLSKSCLLEKEKEPHSPTKRRKIDFRRDCRMTLLRFY